MSERPHDELERLPSMNLPPDLAALERTLRGGLAAMEPDPAVRERVLAAVRRELRAAERRQFWQYVGAVAAVFLIALNLSFSAAANTLRPRLGPGSHNRAALREAIERLELDLSEEEIARRCVLLSAGEELLPMGRPYGTPAAWGP